MGDEIYMSYASLDDYFADHPDEENDFYDDMAFLAEHDPADYPEDWES